uniref:Uncharacterized protein n=1 Tax=Oryza meridionalis TaxID=40149 RepID=A0A0E0D4I7_9ORYZ
MEEENNTMAVETKALLWALLPNARQHLNQQGGVHLGQEQQPTAATRRLLNDGWLLLHNVELMSIPCRYILP